MDDAPDGLRNDFKSAVTFLLPTDPVPNKIKETRSVSEISATNVEENKTSGGNFPRKKMGSNEVIKMVT